MHIDLRETMRQDKRWARHYWTLLVMNLIIVVAIGVGARAFSVHTCPPLPPLTSPASHVSHPVPAGLGVISAAIVYFESFLFKWRDAITNAAMWPCAGYPSSGLVPFGIVTGDSSGGDGDGSGGGCAGDETPRRGDAFGAFLGYNCGLVLLAALCTFGAPKAAGSGLAQVKAYLNGTGVRENLRLSTLVAKVVGITLIVSTGLPLGKEGPMVHTGAIVASGLSRVIVPWTRGLLELRLPSSQREWVGMGCAAGVAAAFNAPLGGILYSFEEVCSSWSESSRGAPSWGRCSPPSPSTGL